MTRYDDLTCLGKSRRSFIKKMGLGVAIGVFTTLPSILTSVSGSKPLPSKRPNVIVFFSDDQGMGDVGVYGSKDIPTPHIDSIAKRGVRFTDGYVSCSQCAPSRAGLITGRYQNRYGFEYNYNNAVAEDLETAGLPVSEKTIGKRFKEEGYTTGIIGKWHMGHEESEQFHPLNRGFDYFFGMLRGASEYLPRWGRTVIEPPILRNREQLQITGSEYLTDVFGNEVVSFIDRHKSSPFFLYVPFNAPHTPLQATDNYLKRVENIKDETRRIYAAMVVAMDDAIGTVLKKLRAEGLEENTVVIFLSDNGGVLNFGGNNGIYRGEKGSVYEGGIRVPFVMQWPAGLPAGITYEKPVISLDILPTVLAASGRTPDPKWNLDGVNLIPYLTGKMKGAPHEKLCWRLAVRSTGPNDIRWAIRMDDWKLIAVPSQDKPVRELYNLAEDPGEKKNIISRHPDIALRLEAEYRKWESGMASPAWRLKPTE